jgi:hypothetical protein
MSVTAASGWSASVDDTWVSVTVVTASAFRLSFTANKTKKSRSSTLSVKGADGVTETIVSVIQQG